MNPDRYLKDVKLAGSGSEKEYRYWMNKLDDDIVMSAFPTVPCGNGTDRCGRLSVNAVCSCEVYDRLVSMARESNYGIYMILLATMGYLLCRYTGSNDVITGMPVFRSGQESREVPVIEPVSCPEQGHGSAAAQGQDSLMLSCGGILPLRTAVDEKMTFKDLLMEVKRTVTEADENANFPFERLSEIWGGNGRKSDTGPHIGTVVLLEQIHEKKSLLNVNADVVFQFALAEKTLNLKAEYDASLYDQAIMEQICGHFFRVLETVTGNPGIGLSEIEILAEEEKDRLLYGYNDTHAQYPADKTIDMLFREQAGRTPGNTAVVLGEERLNYRELDAASDRIAEKLGGCGIKPDDIVGIMAHRSIETVAGILGILKAGGAYLPIDPEYPEERIGYMLGDSGAKALLVQGRDSGEKASQARGQTGGAAEPAQEPEQGGAGAEPGSSAGRGIPAIDLCSGVKTYSKGSWRMDEADGGMAGLAGKGCSGSSGPEEAGWNTATISRPAGDLSGSDGTSRIKSGPADLAYVIYTSGTTGRPKGAMIEHRNVVRLLFNDKMQYDFNDRDVWTLFHSFCFDFSVWEMYGALLYGGKLVIVPRPVAQDPAEYLKLLKKHKVTVLNQTPTAFYRLSEEEVKTEGKDLALRYAIFGGEALQPLMLKAWREKYPCVKLVNMYGITETTVHVTYKEITETEIGRGISNIGRPIPTLTTYVMDRNMRLLPVGAAGELCVGGDGVGRGYLNRPELTREKFMDNPCKQGERLYRSGDLARLLPDGDMEYLGRIDQQVKIRGHRIELGEIEAAALSCGPVREAAAVAGEDEDGNRHICVYYVSEQAIPVGEFRKYLAGKLPGYMIPSYYVHLERIPLTANNKVDRKALPKPGAGAGREEEYEAPADERESKLAEIWKDVLKLEKAGACSDFFNTGGDSIKAISLVSRINREFGSNLQIKDIYMNQTIRELAGYLATAEGKGAGDELRAGLAALEEIRRTVLEDEKLASLLPEDTEDFYPLSPIQQGMVFFTQIMPEEPIYHDQFPYMGKIRDFDIVMFNEAMRLLAQRHPILRTTFRVEEFNEPIQAVHSVNGGILPIIGFTDLSVNGCEEQERIIRSYMEEDLKDKFRFGNRVLWRMHVFGLGNDDYCIVPSYQHAALDGWSAASLMSELFEITDRLKNGGEYIAEKLKSSYRDYVAYNLGRKASEKTREYWRETLKGYTRNKLPFNISNRKSGGEGRSRILRRDLDPGLLNKLEEKAGKLNCTLRELCICAHTYLLCLTSGEEDIVTGVVTHDRPAVEDGDKVLGCFLNTLPLRVKVESGIRKADLLREVKTALRNAKANELFLADIAGIIGDKNANGNPVFDVIFNFMDFHILKSVEESGKVDRVENLLQIPSNEMTNTLLDIEISRTLDYFYLQVKYSPNYFSAEDMETAADLYERILEELASDGGECLGSEMLLTDEEVQKLVVDFNDTQVEYAKEKTLHGLFEEQAARTPDNIALVSGDMRLTYGELNRRANRLARLLMNRGVKNGDNVGLIARRGFDMIAGMLAILKSGGAYIPIDPDYPASRREYIAANADVAALVTDGEYGMRIRDGNDSGSRGRNDSWDAGRGGRGILNGTIPEEAAAAGETVTRCENGVFGTETCGTDIREANTRETVIRIDHGEMEGYGGENVNLAKDSKDLAYVIYTSGSTGSPKGVMIEHHSAVNLISWVNRQFEVGEKDALLFLTSMCFDLSVYDIFGILASGGRVVIAGREQVQNPAELERLLTDHQITFWDSVPSTMNFLVNYLENGNERYMQNQLRLVFMSGDWIPVDLPGRLRRYFPNAEVISLGGATEGTVWSNWYPVTTVGEDWASIPYGKPIANNRFYILDKKLKPVPKGVAGELYIGGAGVARGYMNDEAKTMASFMRDPFLDSPDAVMYRTGDLGRMLPDWNMEFLGRKDCQVKIRGYRVELGEIESKLLRHPAVREAIVADRTGADGSRYLCAYIVWEEERTAVQMRDFLLKELPDYMVPSYFVGIDAIPLTANGKIDRKALPEPLENINTGVKYTAPRNELENELADIWSNELDIERVGIDDEFFVLGGDSLKAMKITAEAKKRNVVITIPEIFRYRSIRGILESRVSGSMDQLLHEAEKDANATASEPAVETTVEMVSDPASGISDEKAVEKAADAIGAAIEEAAAAGIAQQGFPDRRVLDIVIQRDITVYTHRSVHLCIIFSNPNMIPWYNEHYINVFSRTATNGQLVLDFLEPFLAHRDVLREYRLGSDVIARVSFLPFLVEKINEGFYAFIYVDEYYLPGKPAYQEIHYIGPILVYGYDNTARKLFCLGYDRNAGGIFTEMLFDYDDFVEAYQQGVQRYKEEKMWPDCIRSSVTLYTQVVDVKDDKPYPFSMRRFLTQLGNCISSEGDDTILYFWGVPGPYKYGFKIYEDLISHLENSLKGKITVRYIEIHLLYEHKKLLAQRFQFIMEYYHIDREKEVELADMLDKFHLVVEEFNQIRLKCFDMYYNLPDSKEEDAQEKLLTAVKEIIGGIRSAAGEEYTALSSIYNKLKSMDLK